MSWFQFAVLAFLVLIAINLFKALITLVKGRGNSKKTARYLGYRVGLSILAFVLLLAGTATNLTQLHGLNPQTPPTSTETTPQQ